LGLRGLRWAWPQEVLKVEKRLEPPDNAAHGDIEVERLASTEAFAK